MIRRCFGTVEVHEIVNIVLRYCSGYFTLANMSQLVIFVDRELFRSAWVLLGPSVGSWFLLFRPPVRRVPSLWLFVLQVVPSGQQNLSFFK